MRGDEPVLRTLPWDGAPLDPTSPQAQEWLAQELAKSKYHAQPSLIERFLAWLMDLLGQVGGGPGLPRWVLLVVLLAVLALVVLVARVIMRRDRGGRSGRSGSGATFDEVGVSAEEYRRRAAAALARGEASVALVEAYRAVVAGAVERVILDDAPGRTAREAAAELGPAFPEQARALVDAAAAFDAVRYGHGRASLDAAHQMLALDTTLTRQRPVTAALAGISG